MKLAKGHFDKTNDHDLAVIVALLNREIPKAQALRAAAAKEIRRRGKSEGRK